MNKADRNRISYRGIGKHKCLYCDWRNTDLEIIKKHEEELHGCFRDKNARRKKSKPKKSITKSNITLNGVDYKYNNTTKEYEEIEYGLDLDLPDISFVEDNSYLIKCKNCGIIKRIYQNPFEIRELRFQPSKVVKRDMNKQEYPILICMNCGLNMFEDNRHRVYKWIKKGNKLPSGIKESVVLSVEDMLEDTIKKRRCLI